MSLIGVNLIALQDAVAARLQSDLWFSAIPVLSRRLKNLQFLYAESLSKIGMSAVVAVNNASSDIGDELPFMADTVSLSLLISEDVLFNKTGKRALQTTQVAWALLHHWVPTGLYTAWPTDAPALCLWAASPTILLVEDSKERISYELRMNASAAWEDDGA